MTMTTPTPIYHNGLTDHFEFRIHDKNNERIASVPVLTTFREDVERAEQIANDFVTAVNNHQRLMEENRALREALEKCKTLIGNIPLTVRQVIEHEVLRDVSGI